MPLERVPVSFLNCSYYYPYSVSQCTQYPFFFIILSALSGSGSPPRSSAFMTHLHSALHFFPSAQSTRTCPKRTGTWHSLTLGEMAWNSQEGQGLRQRLLRAFLPAPTPSPRQGTGAQWQKWLWAETWQKGPHWILPLWRKCSTAWSLRMEPGIPFPIMQLGRERLGRRENGQGASLSRGLVMLPDTSDCWDLLPRVGWTLLELCLPGPESRAQRPHEGPEHSLGF